MTKQKQRRRFSTPQEVLEALVSGEVRRETLYNKVTPTASSSPEYQEIIREGLKLYSLHNLAQRMKKLQGDD
ncbi:hypothetical protein [Serratia rhizosphaerae]